MHVVRARGQCPSWPTLWAVSSAMTSSATNRSTLAVPQTPSSTPHQPPPSGTPPANQPPQVAALPVPSSLNPTSHPSSQLIWISPWPAANPHRGLSRPGQSLGLLNPPHQTNPKRPPWDRPHPMPWPIPGPAHLARAQRPLLEPLLGLHPLGNHPRQIYPQVGRRWPHLQQQCRQLPVGPGMRWGPPTHRAGQWAPTALQPALVGGTAAPGAWPSRPAKPVLSPRAPCRSSTLTWTSSSVQVRLMCNVAPSMRAL